MSVSGVESTVPSLHTHTHSGTFLSLHVEGVLDTSWTLGTMQ